MHGENLNNATVRIEICSTYKTHPRFQSLNVKKDHIKTAYAYLM